MANFGFSLRSTFGLLPKTEKIENQQNELVKEFEKLSSFQETELFKEYTELESYIGSSEFIDFKKEILGLNYKKTEEFTKEQRYLKLKKDKKIVNYFKVLNSDDYRKYTETNESDLLAEYKDLKTKVDSDEHKNTKTELANNLKAEQQKAKDFAKLKKVKRFKTYFEVLNSSDLENYKNIHESDDLNLFNELSESASPEKIKEYKASLKSKSAEETNKLKELAALEKDAEVKSYLKNKEDESVEKPAKVTEMEELSAYLASDEYKEKVDALKFENTQEYKNEQKLKELKNNAQLKAYFKFSKSKKFAEYSALEGSEELAKYLEQETYVSSPEYQDTIESYKFENSEEYSNEQRLKELSNNESIKHWEKYNKNKGYILFKSTADSELLTEYNELDELVLSEKFIEYKNYMLDKEKYQKTEEYTKEQRFNELKNNKEIKWYFKVEKSEKFNEVKKWRVTFQDNFDSSKINEQLWMNTYFWGKMLLNDRYVMAGEKQYYTDNKNFDLNGDTLKIITKNEKAEGKVWHEKYGFIDQNFDYTSGMLCTAHSFRQQYGRFEAKIKIDSNAPVYQAFWLKGEKILPEIDVFKYNFEKANRLQMATFNGDPNDPKNAKDDKSKLNGSSFSKDFYIYSVDWSPEKITWKINGIEVYSTNSNIPAEPLYLILSAGIKRDPNGQDIQSTYEIDWVKCYEKVEIAS